LGPGKGDIFEPLDVGHLLVSGEEEDRFKFRTPPLRNVTLTAPYMHNGVFESLEMVLEHYNDVEHFLSRFEGQGLSPQLKTLLHNDKATTQAVLANLDSRLQTPLQLSEQNKQDLLAFLNALTDPAARNLNHLIPKQVPSGLPVSD
jgi:cytochrome c peroxidase